MNADDAPRAWLSFDPVSSLPVRGGSTPDDQTTDDSWTESKAVRELLRSETGRELLRYVRESETPVELLTPNEFRERFGREADGMYSRGVIFLNRETADDAVQGALTLAHEAIHALDASRRPRSHAESERLALARERRVARDLGVGEAVRADIVHDLESHDRYRESLEAKPSTLAVYDLAAADDEGTAEGRAVQLAAGRQSGRPTREMVDEARRLGFSPEQMGALHTALKHKHHRRMFLTGAGVDLLREAGFSNDQIARVRRAIALANHAALGDDPRFRVGGS